MIRNCVLGDYTWSLRNSRLGTIILASPRVCVQDTRDLITEISYLSKVLKPHIGLTSYSKAARQFLLKWSFYTSMVIRDLTLRSAASFGSFHLLRLLFDEYVFHLVERKVAASQGLSPVGVMESAAANSCGAPTSTEGTVEGSMATAERNASALRSGRNDIQNYGRTGEKQLFMEGIDEKVESGGGVVGGKKLKVMPATPRTSISTIVTTAATTTTNAAAALADDEHVTSTSSIDSNDMHTTWDAVIMQSAVDTMIPH